MTVDVREREYAIAEAGKHASALKTGFLSSCIAFYGVDSKNGVAFLCHLDFHARGLNKIVCDLRERTKGDLSGFDLYVTSGWNLWFRMLLVAVVFLLVSNHPNPYVRVGTDVFAVYLFFGPLLLGYFQLVYYFRKRVKFKFLWANVCRRVEVVVDAKKDTPADPRLEYAAPAETQKHFGPRQGRRFWAPISNAPGSSSSELEIAASAVLAEAKASRLGHRANTKPVEGQPVAAITAPRTPAVRRLGIVVSIADEPLYGPDGWDEQLEGQPAPTAAVWTIETLDAEQQRFMGCDLVAIPTMSWHGLAHVKVA